MYKGYRVKINGTEVPNLMISAGTYSFVKKNRTIQKYEDGNGIEHNEYFDTSKANISFSLRERTLEEQESIKDIFAQLDNIEVTYWDDYACEYKTGIFKMEEPKIKHKSAVGNDLQYNTTAIVLEEH